LVDHTATARVQRLIRWLEQFKNCFGHRAQLLSLRTYVQGVFSDSERKSMQAMLARVTEPVSSQAFQHFITHAPWDADRVWRRLRAVLPERRGVLILDGTSFPKQGPSSVGVARQYCGALGKIANCQVAVTAALWTGVRAWCLGAALYLPEDWVTPSARHRARIPASVRFQEKWRLALLLLRQVRAAGIGVTAVLADAEFGTVTAFRAALHRLRLPYAVGTSSDLTVFPTRPRVRVPAAHRRGRPRTPATDGAARRPDRGRRARRAAAPSAVAPRHVAQWNPAAADRALRGRAGHPRPRLARRPTRTRGLVALRRGDRDETPAQVLLRPPAGHGLPARLGRLGASALGHRAAVPGTQKRIGPPTAGNCFLSTRTTGR
jgi:SRSO17 transposase